MKLATTTGDFSPYTLNIDEMLKYISLAGFRYVDYNFHTDYNKKTGFFSSDDEGYLKEVKKAADKYGVKFVQAHSPMGDVIGEGEGGKAFLETTKKCVLVCRELGIDRIVVHSGYAKNISKEETFERNRRFYNEVLETAEDTGVNVLTENFNKMFRDDMYWIDNIKEQRELIDFVNHPLFHGCLDTGHNNMQETSPYEAVKILGKHLFALHVQDNLGDDDSHMAPFCGSVNLDSLMCGLIETGYKGYFTFEATRMLRPASGRRPFEGDTRLSSPSIELRGKAEKLLYDIGEYILSEYNCFEE